MSYFYTPPPPPLGTPESIMAIVDALPDYKTRSPRLKKTTDYSPRDDWYSHLVNVWIPGQPDAQALMRLFIEVGFSPLIFVELVVKRALSEKTLELLKERTAEPK